MRVVVQPMPLHHKIPWLLPQKSFFPDQFQNFSLTFPWPWVHTVRACSCSYIYTLTNLCYCHFWLYVYVYHYMFCFKIRAPDVFCLSIVTIRFYIYFRPKINVWFCCVLFTKKWPDILKLWDICTVLMHVPLLLTDPSNCTFSTLSLENRI